MRPWVLWFCNLLAGLGELFFRVGARERGHRGVGPDRMERRQDRVTEMARDKDGLRRRIISRTVARERRCEGHPIRGGGGGREPGIRHTQKSKRGGGEQEVCKIRGRGGGKKAGQRGPEERWRTEQKGGRSGGGDHSSQGMHPY